MLKPISAVVSVCFALASVAGPVGARSRETPRIRASTNPCAMRTPDPNNQGIHAGTYLIPVRDSSARRYFRFSGNGITRHTTASFVGTKTWRVRLTKGTYRFRCGRGSLLQGSLRTLP
jgi:hypothetical protein